MRKADRLTRLGTETAFEVLAQVVALERQGKSVINFAIGEPDFNTPDNVKDAGIKAIRENQTHYSPSAPCLDDPGDMAAPASGSSNRSRNPLCRRRHTRLLRASVRAST